MTDLSENIKIRSEEVQEILTAMPSVLILWGNTLLLLLFFMLFSVSWFVKYPDVIVAQAVIRTKGLPQKELAAFYSEIDTILVKDNDQVYANDPVVVLENSANFQDVFLLKSLIDSIQTITSDFEIGNLPFLTLGEIEPHFALFENSCSHLQLHKQLRPFDQKAMASQRSYAKLMEQLRNLEAQKEISLKEMIFKKKELERNRTLHKDEVIATKDFEKIQIRSLEAERSHKSLLFSISQIKSSLSETEFVSVDTKINQTKEEKKLYRELIQSYSQLKNAIKEWELKYVLKAKVNGVISFYDFQTQNKTISTGDPVFVVYDGNPDEFIAKLKAPSQNFGKIKLGQAVNIKIDNYSHSEFGSLRGQLKSISQIVDEDGLYDVTVALPDNLTTSYNRELVYQHDMKGTAEIITDDLRLIERLFYQLKSIFIA